MLTPKEKAEELFKQHHLILVDLLPDRYDKAPTSYILAKKHALLTANEFKEDALDQNRFLVVKYWKEVIEHLEVL